jgi:hypothetical protein
MAGSPLLNAGSNLSSLNISLLNVDKNGLPRSLTGAWDIGVSTLSNTAGPQPPTAMTAAVRPVVP